MEDKRDISKNVESEIIIYQTSKSNISGHIKHIFEEGELEENSVFRRWATERLKEYMIKGFTLDDERLKNLGGGNYWKELFDRIRDMVCLWEVQWGE